MNETIEVTSTKERILDAAEQLFAEHGLWQTSLRQITAAAGVNLAAVNYHFHSKEALIQAVFSRRLEPVNRERLELLDAIEARSGRRPPRVEEIIEAFFAPALRLRQRMAPHGTGVVRLFGRMYAEPGERVLSILREQFGKVAERFSSALRRALPELPPEELMWRIHFMIGGMAHTMTGTGYLQAFGVSDLADVDAAVRRLVVFMAAGLRAPVPALQPQARRGSRNSS